MRKSQFLIMTFLARERDREFELELLRIQLEHDRKVALFTIFGALGGAFIIFALTSGVSILLAGIKLPNEWTVMILIYFIGGAVLAFGSLILIIRLNASTNKEIETLRKKYSDW